MRTTLVAMTMGTYMVLASQAFAGEHEHGPSEHHENGHHSAPEPLTVLGLALGAGGIATVRWLQKRKS